MTKNDENIKQPIPGWVKYGSAALGAIVLTIIIILLKASGHDELKTNLAELEMKGDSLSSITPPLPEKSEKPPVDIVEKLEQASGIEMEEPVEAPTDPELTLPFAQDQSDTLNKLEQLQANLTELEVSSDIRQDQHDALINELRAQLASQQAQVNQILEQMVPRKQVKKPASNYKPRLETVPFTLVSVDRWGDDLYAVIRYEGQLKELTMGQSLDDWMIESINLALGSVTIKNQSGKRKDLLIKS